MSTFAAHLDSGLADFLANPGRSVSLDEPIPRMGEAVPADVLSDFQVEAALYDDSPTPPGTYEEFPAAEIPTPGQDWFDRIIIVPKFFSFGNILTNIVREIDIYNSWLYESRDLDEFTNNAGEGTEVTDLPSLPHEIPAQRSLLLTLEVSPSGAPTISTTLDFEFSDGTLISLPISGTRIVLFPFEPEAPLIERLQFLTDVHLHKDGTEQRISLRVAPRQLFDLVLRREDGPERQRLDFMLYDWQSRVFGLPMWTDAAVLTTAAAIGNTSLSVDTTTLSDFRGDGGLAVIFASETDNETVEIESVTDTTINLRNALGKSFPVGTRVIPVLAAITTQPAREKRYAVNLADIELTMRITENITDLSDTTDWPTYNGKILLSDPNAMRGSTVDGLIDRNITVFDGETGAFSHTSTWDFARRSSAKTFITTTRERLWEVRCLLHHLRGRQVSFYIPTFAEDLTLASIYPSGNAAMVVHNVGYSRFVAQRGVKKDIRIILNDGTIYERTITASAEVDEDTEQITLSSTISQNIEPDDILRIEFVEKMRMDADEIVIEHTTTNGNARIGFPVKVVME